MANSTTQTARKRSRVMVFHCITWSIAARYLNMAASTTKPMTTFTRASQPPERGSFFRYWGKIASRKNGSARPLAKTSIPSNGRAPPPCTEAASSVPINGPTQAKEASANVRPIIRVPIVPPDSDFWLSAVSRPEGSVISNAPSRLSPKIKNTVAITALTQIFEPNCTTPNGPRIEVTARPSAVNRTTMPRQKITACETMDARDAPCLLRKNDMVIGIIGKTQGVNMEARPNPNATPRKANRDESGSGAEAARGLASEYPAGMLSATAAAPGDTLSFAA